MLGANRHLPKPGSRPGTLTEMPPIYDEMLNNGYPGALSANRPPNHGATTTGQCGLKRKQRGPSNLSAPPLKRYRVDTADAYMNKNSPRNHSVNYTSKQGILPVDEPLDADLCRARYVGGDIDDYATASEISQRKFVTPLRRESLPPPANSVRFSHSNIKKEVSTPSPVGPISKPGSSIDIKPRCRQCKKGSPTRYDPIVECGKCLRQFHETCGIFVKGADGISRFCYKCRLRDRTCAARIIGDRLVSECSIQALNVLKISKIAHAKDNRQGEAASMDKSIPNVRKNTTSVASFISTAPSKPKVGNGSTSMSNPPNHEPNLGGDRHQIRPSQYRENSYRSGPRGFSKLKDLKDGLAQLVIERRKPEMATNDPAPREKADSPTESLEIPNSPSQGSNGLENTSGTSLPAPMGRFGNNARSITVTSASRDLPWPRPEDNRIRARAGSLKDDMTPEEIIAKIVQIQKRPSRKATFRKLLAFARNFRMDVHNELEGIPRVVKAASKDSMLGAGEKLTRHNGINGSQTTRNDDLDLLEHVIPILHNGQLAFISENTKTFYQPFK